ncbi:MULTISPECIES: DUF2510 domain-containing protein [unclassified Cryobacterium]
MAKQISDQPSAGWYVTPDDDTVLRYWNGHTWTSEERSIDQRSKRTIRQADKAAAKTLAAEAAARARELAAAIAVEAQKSAAAASILAAEVAAETQAQPDRMMIVPVTVTVPAMPAPSVAAEPAQPDVVVTSNEVALAPAGHDRTSGELDAGWHPDPMGALQLRWWDGARWTNETMALPAPGVPVTAAAPMTHGRAIARDNGPNEPDQVAR